MSDNSWEVPEGGASENEVVFDYIKSDNFRTVWADGVIGGITPRGLVHFAPYVERQAIPRRQVYAIEKTDSDVGSLGSEIVDKRISRNSVVREMSFDLLISRDQAEEIANWLLERVKEINEREEQFSRMEGVKE